MIGKMHFILLILNLVLQVSGAAPACRPQRIAKKAVLTLPSGRRLRVDVADTQETREKGLMCVTRLPKDYGMLFVFPREMGLQFWMKDTLVPLDMLWIGADHRIQVIHARVPASRVDTPEELVARAGGRGQYVLEISSGAAQRWGLHEGDALAFSVPSPSR